MSEDDDRKGERQGGTVRERLARLGVVREAEPVSDAVKTNRPNAKRPSDALTSRWLSNHQPVNDDEPPTPTP
jgi:hypothetical protein